MSTSKRFVIRLRKQIEMKLKLKKYFKFWNYHSLIVSGVLQLPKTRYIPFENYF